MFATMKSKLGLAGIVAICIAIYLLFTQYIDYREESARLTLPVKAVQTRAAAKWKTQEVPGCPKVVELLPGPKDRKRLERDFGVSLGTVPPAAPVGAPGAGNARGVAQGEPERSGVLGQPDAPSGPEPHVLGLFEVPRMPRGGSALAVLPPSGVLDLRFKPYPPSFLGFRPGYELGAVFAPDKPMDDFQVWGAIEPLRIRQFHFRGQATFDRRPGLDDDLRLQVGAVWRRDGS